MMVSACSVVLHTTTCFSDCALCEEYDPPSFWRSIHVKASCSNCQQKQNNPMIQIITVVIMKNTMSWNVTGCILAEIY
jgi:hypothetical protein